MGRKIRSNIILIAMISLCLGAIASAGGRGADSQPALATVSAGLTDSAQGVASTLLLAGSRLDLSDASTGLFAATTTDQGKSIAERALDDAAHNASAVASELEMPFFSFGGSASSE